jgi:hypothetical protein
MSARDNHVVAVLAQVQCDFMGCRINFRVEPRDPDFAFLVLYEAKCITTQQIKVWQGRWWVVHPEMPDDEIVKTAWLAVEIAMRHELMESFRWKGKRLFNPHADLCELQKLA